VALDAVAGDVAGNGSAHPQPGIGPSGPLRTGIAKAPYVAEFVRLLLESTENGRLDRDGQTVTPAIYYLTSEDGSDPVISEVLQVKRQQAEPIRDPNRPLFSAASASEDRVRLLAEAALNRIERPR